MLGLYRLADTRAFGELRRMALHPEKRRRASALWAIGKTGDSRFSDVLVNLLKDEEPALRREALQVMRRIKEQLARAGREVALPVRILALSARGEQREAWVVVRRPGGGAAPELPATAFLLRENGSPVEEYTVERPREEDAMNIGILVLAGRGRNQTEFSLAQQALAKLMHRKRPQDRCALLRLRCGEPDHTPAAELQVALTATPGVGEVGWCAIRPRKPPRRPCAACCGSWRRRKDRDISSVVFRRWSRFRTTWIRWSAKPWTPAWRCT